MDYAIYVARTQKELRVTLTKEQLRQRLNLPSTRMVDQLMRKRKIPYLALGYKTVRFEWPKVLAALAKFEKEAIG